MDDKMFNQEIKLKYLDRFENEDTREVYGRLFRKSYEREVKLNKDIYNFNDNDIQSFLKEVVKPKTKESARTYCNVLSNYIDWAIGSSEINDAENLTNPMKRRQDYYYEFVADNRVYFSLEEKQALTTSLKNKQDSVIIDALWEGIQGTKLSELVNLRIADVQWKNKKIILRDNEGNATREIKYDHDSCPWFDEVTVFENALLANKEYEYLKMNGTVDYIDNVRDSVLLPVKSAYVLKSAPTNSKDNENGGQKVSYYTVHNRLEMIRGLDEYSDFKDMLTTKNIVRSGMIYTALQLYKRDKELGRNQLEEICRRYNMNYKWSLKDFLNMDTLVQLYPEEFEGNEATTE